MAFSVWATSSWTGWLLLALLVLGWAVICALEWAKNGKWRNWWMLGGWPVVASLVYVALAFALWISHLIKAGFGLL